MAFFDFLSKKQIIEKKNSSSMMGYFGVGASRQRDFTYQELANEGYLKNAIVYRCVNEISKGASSVPFVVQSFDHEKLEVHPAIDLLNRPNPLQSYSEFMNAMFGFLMLSGNAYILRVQGSSGTPRELYLLRPDRVRIVAGAGAMPSAYEYVLHGKVQARYDVDQENGFSDLKQIKLWNPLDDYYGCSPMNAAAVEVDQHNLASQHNINLLNNGARPSGAVIFKPKDESGMSVNLSESQRQQILTDLNNRFSGTSNTGRPMLLEGDFDWREMGLSPKDMDFINLKHMSATDIAMCFGVPSQLVGVPDAQTYSNVAEARLALYEETILPYLIKVQSDLNEWLMPMFKEDLHLHFDTDQIPALSERRRRIYENVIGAVGAGIMTRNEARDRLGLNSIEGADGLMVNAALFSLNDPEPDEPDNPIDEDDIKGYEQKERTNYPKRDDDKKISLRNSNYPQFDFRFASALAEDTSSVGKKIWKAGGNIRGTDAFRLWEKARDGVETPAVLSWIRERESWAARHLRDGDQFVTGTLSPNLSNIGGLIAQIKWGVINPKLGEQGMKDVVLEVVKKLEGKKSDIDDYDVDALGCDESDVESLFDDQHAEKQKPYDFEMSDSTKKGIQNKVDTHNEKYGDNPKKRATFRMLEAVFRRGVGAYYGNPQSVRPSVTSPDQWAYARINSFLFALRTGRFQGAKFDTDLLPKGHPLSSKS